MNKILSLFLSNRLVVIVLTFAVVIAGLLVTKNLPIDVFPELKVPRVTVQTEAAGLTATEVEQYISIPLESAMSGAAGVKSVRSSSGAGLSFVWVEFDWDTDLYRARQIVSERLATVRDSLPAGTESELTPIVSVTGEIMLIALTGDKDIQPQELRLVGEYALRNKLMGIPGVGQVTVLGGRLPEYQILFDPQRLREAGVTLDQLKEAISGSQSTLPAGYLEHVAGLELPLQQEGRIKNLEQVERAIIPGHPGALRVGDVASVKIAGAPRRGDASYKDQSAVVLSVQKIPGANTLKLTEAVDKAIAEFEQSQLPKGMHLNTNAYRQADFINLSLENGEEILILAAIIVILVVFLILMNLRTALITLVAMPLSVILALLAFPLFDLAINIMTLGGLAVAVGDVVDNAIIFVELAWRKLQLNSQLPPEQRESKFDVLLKAKSEIVGSISFSSIIILLVFTPLLFLSGIEGQFFRPLGIAFMLALLASLIVAITVIPVLCYIFFKPTKMKEEHQGSNISVRIIQKLYTPILNFCMRYAKSVCLTLGGCTVGALALASTFGTSFLPPFNEDCFTVFVSTVPGTSLDETLNISHTVMKDIEAIPGVISVTQRAGRAENDEHAEPVSASELLVRVDLKFDQKSIKQEIKNAIDGIPGTSTLIGYPLAHRISSALSGSASEVAINIYGDDLAQLRLAAVKAKEILSSMPEVSEATANREILVDTLQISYNHEAVAAAGLSIAQVGEQVSTALNGLKLGEVIKNQDKWNLMLRIDPKYKSTAEDIKNLEILSPTGQVLRLRDIANVSLEPAPNMILRDNGRRKAMVSCSTSPTSNIGDLAKACREKLDPAMYAMGCTVDYDGTIKARESASTRLTLLGVGVLVLIVLLLTIALKSFKQALLTLVNIPLCLVGGILAVFLAAPTPMWTNLFALLSGSTYIPPILSVASIVGFVTVIGFAIRSGLIMLTRYQDLEKEGLSPLEAIQQGSKERVIPIIITSLTTILGLLPIIWAIDQPGGELLGPLAIVQFGGLISATFLNLLILPAVAKLSLKKKQILNRENT